MSPARAVIVDARQAVLQVAAAALHERVASVEVRFEGVQGPNRLALVGCWRWPGFVRVRLAWRAELLAESLLGAPHDMFHTAQPTGPLAACFTLAERQAALDAAAALLQDRARLPRERVQVLWQGVTIDAVAVWHWPGLVRVSAIGTAELLAQSLPGQPATLDTSCV